SRLEPFLVERGHVDDAPNGQGAPANGHAGQGDVTPEGSSQPPTRPTSDGRFDAPPPALERHRGAGKSTPSSGEVGRRMRELGYAVDQIVSMGVATWDAVRKQGIHERDYDRWRASQGNGVAASGSFPSQPGMSPAAPSGLAPTESLIIIPYSARVKVT